MGGVGLGWVKLGSVGSSWVGFSRAQLGSVVEVRIERLDVGRLKLG